MMSEKECLKLAIDNARPEITEDDVNAVVLLLMKRGKSFIRPIPGLSELYLKDD